MTSLFCCPFSYPASSTARSPSARFLPLNTMSSKKVTLSVLSREQSEGVGARVRRSIGRPEVCWLGGCFMLFLYFCRRDLGREGMRQSWAAPWGTLGTNSKLSNWGLFGTSPTPRGFLYCGSSDPDWNVRAPLRTPTSYPDLICQPPRAHAQTYLLDPLGLHAYQSKHRGPMLGPNPKFLGERIPLPPLGSGLYPGAVSHLPGILSS